MLLRLTLRPETEPGTFFVAKYLGDFAHLTMHMPAPQGIVIDRIVSKRPYDARSRHVVYLRRLDGERWTGRVEVTPGFWQDVTLTNWEWIT